MGLRDKLIESILKIRVVPKSSAGDNTSFATERDSLPNKVQEAIESGKRVDLSDLGNITQLKGDRNQKYSAFEEMVADGRIGAAVEMYANDTVQYNPEGKIIWVESEDSEVAQYANKLLDDLNIAENLWSYAYCLWLYGDVYLELFQDTSYKGDKPTLLVEPTRTNPNIRTQSKIPGSRLERYIEKIANPAEVYDLQYKGKTSGFIRSPENLNSTHNNNTYTYSGISSEINILQPTKFVHICLSPNINRFPEKFKLIQEDLNKKDDQGRIDASYSEGSGGNLSFTVKTGQSILENVYSAYQTLKLKEDSVLLERITKSSITRIIQVELGDLPESKKRQKLQEIKNQIEQQMMINKQAGTIESRAGCQPTENIIYTSTRQGKGAISSVNIGGDVNIGDLADVEDSENKVYGALLTPKALLGADMDGSGLSNGGSLTEMNTTYARRIKRGQVAITTGIKNLINIFALSDRLGEKVVNNFEVKLTPIITVEDNRRDELLQTKIRNVNDIMNLFSDIEGMTDDVKMKMLTNWLSKYLNQQDIVTIIDNTLKEQEQKNDEQNDEQDLDDNKDLNRLNSMRDTKGVTPKGSIESKPELNINSDIEKEEIPNNTEKSNPITDTNKPEMAPQKDLASIQGEDLL